MLLLTTIVAVTFIILVLTFTIDKYLFNSRYLVHIGGVGRKKDDAAVLDEKASLHEKEALNVESGLRCSNDEDSDLEPKPQHDSDSPASTAHSRRLFRVIEILAILFVAAFWDCKDIKETPSETHRSILESSSFVTEAEEEVNKSRPTSRWGRFIQHPVLQKVLDYAILVLILLYMLAVFTFHLIFWPLLLGLFVALQCALYEDINGGATVPWQPVAFKSTLYLAIWTIIGVNFLLKPNPLQSMLWKCIKWTHAVNWWLFWVVFEGHYLWGFVARWTGFPHSEILTEMVFFVVRPVLVAYLYSGVVRDAVIAVRLCKFFWNYDLTKS